MKYDVLNIVSITLVPQFISVSMCDQCTSFGHASLSGLGCSYKKLILGLVSNPLIS